MGFDVGSEAQSWRAAGGGVIKFADIFANEVVPGKAKAPGSLVNKGNQGPRYVAVTVGSEEQKSVTSPPGHSARWTLKHSGP